MYGRTTTITHTESVCANPKCQEAVNKEQLALREKREQMAHKNRRT